MTSRDFCYWLQGYIEIGNEQAGETSHGLSPTQLQCVERHLAMVFHHEIDPSFGKGQTALNDIHGRGTGDNLIRC